MPKSRNSFLNEFQKTFVQALEAFGAVAVAYNLVATAANDLLGIVSEGASPLPVLFSITPPGFAGDLLLACLALGFVTYLVLVFVCAREWVQEAVDVEECWKEKDWWNPFHWVWVFVCVVKEVLRWVLKLICRWKEVLVTVAVISCGVAILV